MDTDLARLQAALRAIEQGKRIEQVDDVLVRQVLGHQRVKRAPQFPTASQGERQELYHTLAAVHGSKKRRPLQYLPRKEEHDRTSKKVEVQAAAPVVAVRSPELPPSPVLERHQDADRLEAQVKKLQAALQVSKDASDRAEADLQTQLARAQAAIPASFLFERGLAVYCRERSVSAVHRAMGSLRLRFVGQALTRWVNATAELRRISQRRAASLIVWVYRGHAARRLARELRAQRDRLAAQQRRLEQLRIQYREAQARRIQVVWRAHRRRKAMAMRTRRREAAKKLQRHFRARKRRANALLDARASIKKLGAVVTIQRVTRGHLARVHIKEARRKEAHAARMAETLARNASTEALAAWKRRKRAARFMIARRAVYPFALRRRWRLLIELLYKQRAGRVIARYAQRWFARTHRRGKQPANPVLQWVEAVASEQRRYRHAAVLIQKHLHRWVVQQQFILDRAVTRKRERRNRLAIKQQRASNQPQRAAPSSKTAAFLRSSKPAPVPIQPAVASRRIQAWFRRHRARRKVRLQRYRQRATIIEIRVLTRRRAATHIQSLVRGRLARKLATRLRAERLIHRFFRRRKWQFATVRLQAAATITRWVKTIRSRRLAMLWTLEQQRRALMATLLQRYVRYRLLLRLGLTRTLAIARRCEEGRTLGAAALAISRYQWQGRAVLRALGAGFEHPMKRHLQGSDRAAEWPLVQLVFLVASGVKDPVARSKEPGGDSSVLHTRLERSRALLFFKTLNQAVGKKRPFFTGTDVDVALAQVTGASRRALTFPEFATVLRKLADTKFASVGSWWRLDVVAGDARLLSLLYNVALRHGDLSPMGVRLDARANQVLDQAARVMQRMVRRRRDKLQGALLVARLTKERESEAHHRAAIRIQALARRVLAKRELKTRIKVAYDKLVDPEYGLPYWMNPRSGFSTWRKPPVLGADDVEGEPVPFPPTGRTLKVACQGATDCESCASWRCLDCDESFCHGCLEKYHKAEPTDGDTPHEIEALELCGLCRFQLASRRCEDCLAPRVKANSKETVSKEAKKQALFCDVCFAFLHRRGALQLHRATTLLELCSSCDVDGPSALGHLLAIRYAVQWECEVDHVRICGRCALLSHPVESCGTLRAVSLRTRAMIERIERLAAEREARDRADADKMRQRKLQAERNAAAHRIQRFWRKLAPVHRARRITAALRREKVERWTRIERDQRAAKVLAFRIKDKLGMAPVLPTDSAVMRRLRPMHGMARRRLAHRARAFGLLLPEYMNVGVPLPGVVRIIDGDRKALQTTEDLRGWVKSCQTIRVVRLSSYNSTADNSLSAWQYLAKWKDGMDDGGVLVDVSTAKDAVKERRIALECVIEDPALKESGEFAAFLVEFSMDPKRTVWINHTLAEQLWEWRRLRQLERRERLDERKRREEADKSRRSPPKPATPAPPPPSPPVSTDNAALEGVAAPVYDAGGWTAMSPTSDAAYPAYDDNGWSSSGYTPATTGVDAWNGYGQYGDVYNGYGQSGDGYASYQQYGDGYPSGGEAAALVDSSNYYYGGDGSDQWTWDNSSAAYVSNDAVYDNTAAAVQAEDPYAGYSADANTNWVESASYDQAGSVDQSWYDQTGSVDQSWYDQVGNADQSWYDPQASWPSSDANYGYDTWPAQEQQVDTASSAWYGDPSADAPVVDDYSIDLSIGGEDAASPWEEVLDPETNQTYYYNRETLETSWERPEA